MEHYVILCVHEEGPKISNLTEMRENRQSFSDYFINKIKNKLKLKLLAFDLRDHQIQEAILDDTIFSADIEDFTFTKYKDNQIIIFGGRSMKDRKASGRMIRITVESFKRILDLFLYISPIPKPSQ